MDWSKVKVETAPWPDRPTRAQPPTPSTYECVNCSQRFRARSRRLEPYCGMRCSAEANVVRYARRKRAEYGKDLPEDIQWAIRVQMAHALAGGYDKHARRLSPEFRAAVWERDRGRCVLCGKAGEEIDHIEGPDNDMANLRLLCDPCHNEVTRSRLVPIDDPKVRVRLAELRLRIAAQTPVRACDAHDWASTWRSWVREHAEFSR